MAKLFLIGRFVVNNLLYGKKFQKQMLFCSYKNFYRETKNDFKKVIICL